MILHQLTNSLMNSITYIFVKEGVDYCVLIDCGYSEDLIPVLETLGKSVKAVFLTHAHYDHVYGLNMLLEHDSKILVYTNEEGCLALADTRKNFSKYHPELEPFVFQYPKNVRLLKEQEYELFEGVKMQVLFTPGHDVTCFSFIIGDNLFTGDAYIPGIKTVMSFPRSNRKEAKVSLERLKALEEQGYNVCPGHDISGLATVSSIFK